MNGYFLTEGIPMPEHINYKKDEVVSWTELVENQKVLFIGLPDAPTTTFDFDLIKNGSIHFSILKHKKIMLLTTTFLAKRTDSKELMPCLHFESPFHPNISNANPNIGYSNELNRLINNVDEKSEIFIVAFNSSTNIVERVRAIELDHSFSLKLTTMLNTINQEGITREEFFELGNDLYSHDPSTLQQMATAVCVVDGAFYVKD